MDLHPTQNSEEFMDFSRTSTPHMLSALDTCTCEGFPPIASESYIHGDKMVVRSMTQDIHQLLAIMYTGVLKDDTQLFVNPLETSS